MPKPGPLSPTSPLETGPRAIPSALAPEDDISKAHLTADEVRMRLKARERDIQYHIEALKHEAAAVLDDVVVDGRPLIDRVRERPVEATVIAAGTGLLLGALAGLRARAKRRPDPDDIDFVRARLAVALDDAAHRVAEGADVERAIRGAMASVPVAYADGSDMPPKPKSSSRQAFDVALQTAAGFGVKAVLDVVIRRYTSHSGTLDALGDAAEG